MARREYTAGRATTLSSAFAIGASTFTIADDGSSSTWPTGADFDFFVTIGAGTSNEERVLCSGRNGRVITIADGGRNQENTGEKNHAAGETAWPSLSAQDANEANAHVNSTGYASYSQTVHGLGSGDGVVVGTTKAQELTLKTLTSPKINENVALTATSTELNILDGATLSTAELNYVDGVTSSIQTQINNIASVPAGVINPWAGVAGSPPTGWLLCDGTAVSRSTYSTLFGIIGTAYGAGDNSTTFNVPNLKGRVPVGLDSTQTEFDTRGETGGAKTHALTSAEMPRHNHGINPAMIVGGGHVADPNTGNAYSPVGNSPSQAVTTFFTGGSGTTEVASNGDAHNNLQPYIVVNYIIKT